MLTGSDELLLCSGFPRAVGNGVKGAASSLAMVLLLRLGCLALECGDLGPMVSEAPVSQKPRVVLAAKQKEILCVPLAWK